MAVKAKAAIATDSTNGTLSRNRLRSTMGTARISNIATYCSPQKSTDCRVDSGRKQR